jgi:hypothetical protein
MRTRLALVVWLLPGLAACGEPAGIAVDSTVDRPYDGPLYVEGDPDSTVLRERSGAAGRALECEGRIYGGFGGGFGNHGIGTAQDDAREALESFQVDAGFLAVPQDGYVVERVEGDRVLFSYDVGEQTKVAYIAADGLRDVDDDVGWGIEAWASCDPAEFPASVTDDLGVRVWHDQQGARVPVSTITHYPGPEHCDWQDITFLSMGDPGGGGQYLADREGEFAGQDLLRTTYDGDAVLPGDATDTGYEYDDWHLWLVADRSAAYVVDVDDPSQVERWPAAKDEIACA